MHPNVGLTDYNKLKLINVQTYLPQNLICSQIYEYAYYFSKV
jgi:hypothetical protein